MGRAPGAPLGPDFGILERMNTHRSSAGRDYAIGGVLIVLAAASLYFLDGATAVFIAVIAAVAGAVLIIKGIQASDETSAGYGYDYEAAGTDYLGSPGAGLQGDPDLAAGADFDWDADFQRGFGEPGGNPGSAPGGQPRPR